MKELHENFIQKISPNPFLPKRGIDEVALPKMGTDKEVSKWNLMQST
jgi:hypothetical protein